MSMRNFLISEISELDGLDASRRARKENELYKLLINELTNPSLDSLTWEKVKNLSNNFTQVYAKNELAKALVIYAPTDIAAQEVLDRFQFEHQKKAAREERGIWRNIKRLNVERHEEMTHPSARERWQKISRIFLDERTHRAGRSLQEQYWREAYNLGEYEKVNDKWHEIWRNSNTDLSFVPWCKAIGLKP